MQKLTGVSESLLMTLYGRYLETKRINGIIKDEKSIEIVEEIDYDFSKFSEEYLPLLVAVRTEIIDEQTKKFLEEYPNSTIVNIAAGLCTRFFRLDNGKVKWYDLDLEQVKPYWQKFIGETDRHKYLAYSVLDFPWMTFFQDTQEKKLFIIEGLAMYLSEEEVKKMIIGIKNNLPNSEMLIDVVGLSAVGSHLIRPAISQLIDKFQWKIQNLKDIETWDKGIEVIHEWYCTDRYSERWKNIEIFKDSPAFRYRNKVGQIKFN